MFLCEPGSEVLFSPSWEHLGLHLGVIFETLGALLELKSHTLDQKGAVKRFLHDMWAWFFIKAKILITI